MYKIRKRDIRTYPRHVFDVILLVLIQVTWEPFSRKQSHWWHWVDYKTTKREKLLRIPIKNSEMYKTSQPHLFLNTNFLWHDVGIVRPRKDMRYRIGYKVRSGETGICTIIIKGECGVLFRSNDVEFFAKSYPDNEDIPLEFVRATRKEQLNPQDLLL